MHAIPHIKDWADIQVFLAIADAGTLGAAGAPLGLTQPSVGRRLSAMEERLGVKLFIRDGRRLQLTDAGLSIMDSARRIEREMLAISGALDGQTQGLAGEVTISAAEGIGTEWLTPELVKFKHRHPDILVNIQIENRKADLLHREADIALRFGRPTEADLIGRKLTELGFGYYMRRDMVADTRLIHSLEDLNDLPVVEFSERNGPINIHNLISDLAEFSTARRSPVALTTNSPAAHIAAVRSGIGYGILSHRWATLFPELQRILDHEPMPTIELWLVTHQDVRHSARIRAMADFIAERVTRNIALFEHGIQPPHESVGSLAIPNSSHPS